MGGVFGQQVFDQLQAERRRLADEFGIVVVRKTRAALRQRVAQLVDRGLPQRGATGTREQGEREESGGESGFHGG